MATDNGGVARVLTIVVVSCSFDSAVTGSGSVTSISPDNTRNSWLHVLARVLLLAPAIAVETVTCKVGEMFHLITKTFALISSLSQM